MYIFTEITIYTVLFQMRNKIKKIKGTIKCINSCIINWAYLKAFFSILSCIHLLILNFGKEKPM